MNRLVIIGNGFDLAHGLPTSYKHFIDDFWISFKENCKSDLYNQIVATNDAYDGYYKQYGEIINFNDFKLKLEEYCKNNGYRFYKDLCVATNKFVDVFRFKNDFFLKINNESLENWVDIENLYYSELKKIVKSKCPDITKSEEYWIKEQKKQVEKLNLEFEDVKLLLKDYLFNGVVNKYKSIIDKSEILELLKPKRLVNKELDNFINEFADKNSKKIKIQINAISDSIWKNEFNDFKENVINFRTIFLNFNYTNTINSYVKSINQIWGQTEEIQIHGSLDSYLNPINFGFGDEMDEDYKLIENINDNEFLKNFKSFQYLKNPNYKNLLNFVENEEFQVMIMGHSCGISDRTLLNTIFEHNNCLSIKILYHQWKDKITDEVKDNYTEITQNISRHFNKKKLMREKIVNKTLCKPLPQIQLPKKE